MKSRPRGGRTLNSSRYAFRAQKRRFGFPPSPSRERPGWGWCVGGMHPPPKHRITVSIGIGDAKLRENAGLQFFHARSFALVLMIEAQQVQYAVDGQVRVVVARG